MQYQVDDRVVHINHGVGRVVGLVTNSFAKSEAKLYYEIALDQSTVWVLVQSGGPQELRALTHKRDLERYRAVLRSRPTELSTDHRQRRLDVLQQLKDGSFASLCAVVRDLTARGRIKPLNEIDSMTLRQAHGNLSREWAAADGITITEAVRHIESLMLEGQLA
ncbi:MAG: hypothetical protein JNL73_18690 [Anaerolineales bacterium]|nr:hypothetical protein [Anaerolineales bacterium]